MIARDIYDILFCNDVSFWEATKSLYTKMDNKKLHKLFKRLKVVECKILFLEDKMKIQRGKARKNTKRRLYFKKRLKERLENYINLYIVNN